MKTTPGPDALPPRFERSAAGATHGFRYVIQLVRALAGRDFKYKYRRTLLGPAWALLLPLLMTLVFTAIRSRVKIDVGGVPYMVFAYVGSQAWALFQNGMITAGPSVVSNSGIVKKIALPLEVFPLSSVILCTFDFAISMIVLAVLMVWFHVVPTLFLLWLPVLLAALVLLTFACGLALTSVGTFRKDVIFGVTFLLQVAMLASPVMYEVPTHRGWSWFFLNPTVGIIEGMRDVIIHGRHPAAIPLLVSVGMSLLLLGVGWPLFRRAGRYFADVI